MRNSRTAAEMRHACVSAAEMRTGVSGMNAQANRLSSVADNIANSGTTGYKRSSTEFSSLVIPSSSSNYTSGGVNTNVRYAITQQGDFK